MSRRRLLIIGGVAAGATAAARARRLDEEAEITVLERGPYVSYANCGLPYHVGGEIEDRKALLLQTPAGFKKRYGVDVLVDTEALELDRAGKRVRARGPMGEAWFSYDQLILAQGGNPLTPPVPGADAPHVFRLWTVPDMDRIEGFIAKEAPKTAVVVGGGFIGLEMAEALRRRGLATTVVELLPTVLAVMDREIAVRVEDTLRMHGVEVLAGVGMKAIDAGRRTVELSTGAQLPADLVLFSVGVRPELALAKQAGLAIGPSGGLEVNDRLQTSDPDVYAAGDMVEVVHRVSGRKVRIPLAGPANRQGRIAATNAVGGTLRYGGAVGTAVVKVFEATAAMTGLSARAAREAGLDVGVAVLHKDHHAGYYPGAKELSLELVYDRKTSRILGAQAFGPAGVDKRIDVIATAMQAGMTLDGLAELDLAYAPPYSSANDPVNLIGFIAQNDVSGASPLVTAAGLKAELASATPPVVLDVRNPGEWKAGHLKGALLIPVDSLRERIAEVPRGRRILVHCRSGFRAHLALRILRAHGHADVANVTGGWLSMQAEGGLEVEEA